MLGAPVRFRGETQDQGLGCLFSTIGRPAPGVSAAAGGDEASKGGLGVSEDEKLFVYLSNPGWLCFGLTWETAKKRLHAGVTKAPFADQHRGPQVLVLVSIYQGCI